MTVQSSTARNQYVATSGQTVFTYTFEIVDKGDIGVLKNGTLLSEGTHYTVSGVGVDGGGNVTLLTGATAGDIITLYRAMDLERLTDYQNAGDFLASEVNDDFDRIWMALQQNGEGVSRAIRKPIEDLTSLDMELPVAASRANSVISFDETGAMVMLPFTDQTSVYSVRAEEFVGDGSTVNYVLTHPPVTAEFLNVYIDGVTQRVSSFTLAGATLTFSEAPPTNSVIEVRSLNSINLGSIGLLSDLSDTSISTAVSGEFLRYNGIDWTNQTADINALSNVATSGSTNKQCLQYNGTSWVNANPNLDDLGDVSAASPSTGNFLQWTGSAWQAVALSTKKNVRVTSTSLTAAHNDLVVVDTASQTITLPATPSAGDEVSISVGNFTDTIVGRNGSNIMGDASDLTLDTAYAGVTLVYSDATNGWRLI